jgi:hypothetical protein
MLHTNRLTLRIMSTVIRIIVLCFFFLPCAGQSEMHLKFFKACDSIDRYVDATFANYELGTRAKMKSALQKNSARDYAKAQADNYLQIPYAVLPTMPSARTEAKLASAYNIVAYPFDINILSNERTMMYDSAMLKLILAQYSAAIFDEPAPPPPPDKGKAKSGTKAKATTTSTTAPKTIDTKPVAKPKPVEVVPVPEGEISLPQMNRIADIQPYLRRKFALDSTKVTEGDFAILYFNAAGKLTKCMLISVDKMVDDTPVQSDYLKSKQAFFETLAKKLGWIGPKLNGKYQNCTIALSLYDYTMRVM